MTPQEVELIENLINAKIQLLLKEVAGDQEEWELANEIDIIKSRLHDN